MRLLGTQNYAQLDDSMGPMTGKPDSPLASLNLERTIHLRWVLRDIKGKRTKFMPVSPDDITTLIEMGLVEMRDEIPVLTNEGERAVDWL
jgi:hypothetical protein